MGKGKQPSATGDCYEAHGRIMLEGGVRGLESESVLCHGLVTGQGPIAGERIGHAWIEIAGGAVVLDFSNGNNVCLPAAVYYGIGQIDPEEVKRYTRKEACKQMLTNEHFGPW
jgi:hypothetical protein